MTKEVVEWLVSVNIVTGSTVWSAKCRYSSNSEADFEVFRPHGRHCTDGGEIGNWLQKAATGNGSLQPEIETNKYSSSKKLLE